MHDSQDSHLHCAAVLTYRKANASASMNEVTEFCSMRKPVLIHDLGFLSLEIFELINIISICLLQYILNFLIVYKHNKLLIQQ